MLATGPYHQDFAFPLADAPNTRLSFDLRLSEVVKMRVALKETSLVPSDREYPGDTFAFCLRAIVKMSLFSCFTALKSLIYHTNFKYLWTIKEQKHPNYQIL